MELETIYRTQARTVYLYLLSLSHDPALSEDLMQETFLKAAKKYDSFRRDCALSSWLCAIARNLYFDHCRKVKRRPEPEEMPPADPRDPRIFRCLHRLDEPYREVVWLRTFGLLSFAQIGEVFSKSESWGRVVYYRGKQKLKELWKEEERDDGFEKG